MEGLRRTDHFTAFAKGMLSAQDYQTLTLLYQPIIGERAFVLYCTLQGILDRQRLSSQEYFHTDLESMMNAKVEDIELARYRLEAIGLLSTYYQNDHFLYELKSPLSADQFVNDGVLGEYLISAVSKERFQKLIDIFKIKSPSKKQYIQLTKSFDSVFPSISAEKTMIEADLMASKHKNNMKVVQSPFNWRLFDESLPKSIYDQQLLSDPVKDKIMNLAYVYQLSELEMRDIFILSIDDDIHAVNLNKLAVEARELYKKTSRKPVNTVSETTTHVEELSKDPATYFKTISPIQLLKEMGDGLVSASDLRTVERLIEDIGLDKGVVNVLLAYTAKIKNGVLPSYDYFEKVGMSWKQNQIHSVEVAMEYVIHLQSQSKSSRTSSSKKTYKKDKPDVQIDWLDEYIKSIE